MMRGTTGGTRWRGSQAYDKRPASWSTDEWATPPAFVRQLARRFGTFEIDPCATKATAKAPTYYTIADNGLHRPWRGRVFLNPPYSNPLPWVRRAACLTTRGRCPLVVALLPCCFDTAWFHEWVLPYAEIHFIRGRLRFFGWKGTPIGSPRQPNFLAVYRPTRQGDPPIEHPVIYHSLVFEATP